MRDERPVGSANSDVLGDSRAGSTAADDGGARATPKGTPSCSSAEDSRPLAAEGDASAAPRDGAGAAMGALKPTVVVTASVAQGTMTRAGGRAFAQELPCCCCELEEKLAGPGPRVNERETDDARPCAGVALALVRRAGPDDMDTGGVVASDDIAQSVCEGGSVGGLPFSYIEPPRSRAFVLEGGGVVWWWRWRRFRERESVWVKEWYS